MSDSEQPHGLQPTILLCPWDFPGKSTGVGCHCLLHQTLQESLILQYGRVNEDRTLESDYLGREDLFCIVLCILAIGEGNGNPLQCSCLENPRDGGAWWAAIHWVTQSQTQLK